VKAAARRVWGHGPDTSENALSPDALAILQGRRGTRVSAAPRFSRRELDAAWSP